MTDKTIILGVGVLSWPRRERISDRYGVVNLRNAGDDAKEVVRSPEGQFGTLKAEVLEARESNHLGDILRGLFPRTPKTGDVIILGKGKVFSTDINAIGLEPSDGREKDWLDPRALYDCHNSIVRLVFEPDNPNVPSGDASA